MKVVDSNRYFLEVTAAPARWLHLATVHHNTREFLCFVDIKSKAVYVEEVIGGSIYHIKDEGLAQELEYFLTYTGVLDMKKPLLPDDLWYQPPGGKREV